MALLDQFMQNPATILGLSVLDQANRPAQGLLQGMGINQRLQGQRSAMETEALRRDLMQQQLLKSQQEQDLMRRRQGVLRSVFEPQRAAGPPQQIGGQLVEPQKPSLFQSEPERAITQLATVDPQAAIGFMNALKPGGATNINVDVSEPMKLTDLLRVRDSEGNAPPVGSSLEQIVGARNEDGTPKYTVKSTEEQKRHDNVDTALNLVGTLRNLAFPKEGDQLFEQYEGIFGRIAQGAQNFLDEQGQTSERGKRMRLYNNTRQGFLSMLARTFGERGTLTNQDIDRALKLTASAGLWPDQPDTAKDAFDELEKLIRDIDSRPANPNAQQTVGMVGDTVFILQPDGSWEAVEE